jgi:purine-binding chemotaxis protein CheW
MIKEKEFDTNVDALIQLVSFKLGDEEFGVDIFKVREINKMTDITKVPNAPFFVEGVINLRGKITPVIDLRTRLGLDKKADNSESNIIVVEIDERWVGLVVDKVEEVLRIPSNITEPPPAMAAGIDSEFITAVAKLEDKLLILFDIDKLLSSGEMESLDEMV